MTIQQALDIQQNFRKFNGNYTDDDFFMFTDHSKDQNYGKGFGELFRDKNRYLFG